MRNTFIGGLHSVTSTRAQVNSLLEQIKPEGETERNTTKTISEISRAQTGIIIKSVLIVY